MPSRRALMICTAPSFGDLAHIDPRTRFTPRSEKRLPETVVIGRDGLIVTRGPYSGLLLPQVAPEWGFHSMEFLSQTCVKAGLPPDAWLDEDTMVEHFQAQIFAEVAPGR